MITSNFAITTKLPYNLSFSLSFFLPSLSSILFLSLHHTLFPPLPKLWSFPPPIPVSPLFLIRVPRFLSFWIIFCSGPLSTSEKDLIFRPLFFVSNPSWTLFSRSGVWRKPLFIVSIMRKRERENPCGVCGHYHKYEEGEVCSICGHRIPVGSEKTSIQVSAFPSVVLPEFLYLGSYDNASRSELLKTQGISRILNVRGLLLSFSICDWIWHLLQFQFFDDHLWMYACVDVYCGIVGMLVG